MRTVMIAASATLLVACGSRPIQVSGPAPERERAMDCAMAEATARGFTPMEGGVGSGFVKLARSPQYSASDAGKEVGKRVMTLGLKGDNRVKEEHLTVTGVGNTLRLTLAGVRDNGNVGKPTDRGLSDVEAILAACAK